MLRAWPRFPEGPECSLLVGVQAAMVGIDEDLTLGRKGATEVLEQEPDVVATWEKT